MHCSDLWIISRVCVINQQIQYLFIIIANLIFHLHSSFEFNLPTSSYWTFISVVAADKQICWAREINQVSCWTFSFELSLDKMEVNTTQITGHNSIYIQSTYCIDVQINDFNWNKSSNENTYKLWKTIDIITWRVFTKWVSFYMSFNID